MAESRTRSHRPGRAKVLTWIVIVMLGLAGAYWFVSKKPASTGNSGSGVRGARSMAVPVRVATIESGSIHFSLKAIGTVTAFNTVTVRSRVDGQLQEIAFTDGQKVHENDLLAVIDPRPYQVQLDQALGQQKQNMAQLENARRDLQRYQLLYKQNSIAKQQVDAQGALVQQFTGVQKSNQAAVDSARLQLSFTKIVAPVSGRLGLRKVDRGNLVATSNADGIVVITQTQPISAVFTLPQSQLPEVLEQIRAGQKLVVDLYDRDDIRKIATGELMSLDNQIDVSTGTLKLKARFANEDEVLFPNQFVNVHLHVSTNNAAIVAPAIAIQQGSIGAFVYVVDAENKVHVQPVVTGVIDAAKVAIKAGLQAGQKVVVEGTDRLREGAQVQTLTTNPLASAGAASALEPTESAAAPVNPPASPTGSEPVRAAVPSATATAPAGHGH